METIIFDIETGPLPIEELRRMIPPFDANEVKLGNLKDPDKIREKLREAAASHEADVIGRAALDALTGHVVAIGVKTAGRIEIAGLGPERDEAGLLRWFWSQCRGEMGRLHRLVGFNINAFDLPFMHRRSWALGIAVPFGLRKGRYWSDQVIDLRDLWQLGDRQARGSLDTIGRHLGATGKNGNGAKFAELWFSDRPAAVAYLEKDLELTETIAKRLGVITDEGGY